MVYYKAKKIFEDLGYQLHRKTSVQFFNELSQDEYFDMIYVDGHHRFGQAFWDMCAFFKHIEDDGLLMVDDYSHVHHPDVTLAFNKFIDRVLVNVDKLGYITGYFKPPNQYAPLCQTTVFLRPIPKQKRKNYSLPSIIDKNQDKPKKLIKLLLPRKIIGIGKKLLERNP